MAGGNLRTLTGIGAGVLLLLVSPVLAREVGSFAGVAAVAVAAAVCLLVGVAARRRRARELQLTDPRPPVLYLRPDGLAEDVPRGFADHLARALQGIGPLRAVGSPGDVELGAAGLIVLHAGTSAGLLGGLSRAIAVGRPDRLIVCLPVDPPRPTRRPVPARERYARFRSGTAGIFPRELPPDAEGCPFLYFDPDWTPRLLRVGGPAAADADVVAGGSPTQAAALRRLAREFRRRIAPA